MKEDIRRLNAAGVARFERWLLTKEGPAPREILFDDDFTEAGSMDRSIDVGLSFETTFEIGSYLHNTVFSGIVDTQAVFGDVAMWAWISLAFISDLVSKSNKGGGKKGQPLAVNHYLQSPSALGGRQGYRLIVRSAWWTVRIHGDAARIAFSSKESPWGEHAEQILGRQELASHPGFFAVAKSLYVTEDGVIKSGAAGKRSKLARKNPKAKAGLGAMRRLAQTLNQFSKTYNTRAISSERMLDILPKEYSRFKTSLHVDDAKNLVT